MYKDKAKQKEANRRAKERQRAKGMTKGMTPEGMTVTSAQGEVIPDLELCRRCQVKLPPLEKPRQYPGMCIMCVTEKHGLKQQVSSQCKGIPELDAQGISKRPTFGAGQRIADATVGKPVGQKKPSDVDYVAAEV